MDRFSLASLPEPPSTRATEGVWKERQEAEEAQDKAAKLPSVPQAEPERNQEGSGSESRVAAEEGRISPLTEAKSAPHEVATHETS